MSDSMKEWPSERNQPMTNYTPAQADRIVRSMTVVRAKIAALEAERDALRAQVARLSAPVSDAELTPHLLGKKWPITEAFDALLAFRTAPAKEPEQPKEQS